MKKPLIAGALIVGALSSQCALAVNKCKGPDGRVTYSDLPCPGSTERVGRPDLTNANVRGSGANASLDTTPLPAIDFGSDRETQLNRATAMVASILVDARECDWDLKVTHKWTPCVRFLQQMSEGREWSQAMGKMSELTKDEAFVAEHQADFSKTLRDAQEVVKIKEFAFIRANR